GVAPAKLRVVDVAMFGEHHLALARATGICAPETPRTVGNAAVHRLAHDLRNEEPRGGPAAAVEGDPLPVVTLDLLRLAERAGRGPKGNQRDAGDVALGGCRFDETQRWREPRWSRLAEVRIGPVAELPIGLR